MKFFQSPVLLGFILLMSFSTLSLASAATEVQSFKNWKTQKVKEAEAIVKKAKSTPHKETHAEELYRALLSLEMSKELTVNDYFVIYLSNHKSGKKAFQSAVQKLSGAELAALLWTLKPHPEIVENSTSSPAKNNTSSSN